MVFDTVSESRALRDDKLVSLLPPPAPRRGQTLGAVAPHALSRGGHPPPIRGRTRSSHRASPAPPALSQPLVSAQPPIAPKPDAATPWHDAARSERRLGEIGPFIAVATCRIVGRTRHW